MRVLHVLGSLNRGGIESFLMSLYRKIDRSIIQFDFLIHTEEDGDFSEEVLRLGGKIYKVPPRNKGFFKNRKELDEFFKKYSDLYSIVHFHVSSLTYVSPLYYAKKHGIECRVIHSHNIREGGSFIHKYIHLCNKFFLESLATDYFACSSLAGKWLFTEKILKSDKYKLICNAIDIDRFQYSATKRSYLRKELGIGEDKYVLLNVARFHEQKNQVFLIQMLPDLLEQNPSILLVLVGDGALLNYCKEIASNLNVSEFIYFVGVQSEIENYFSMADLFVFPSLYEGLGIVLIEAQVNSLKVLASKGVIPFEVKISDNLDFIDLSTPELWKEHILKSLNKERNLLDKGKVIEAGYEIGKVQEVVTEFYKKA